MNAEALTQEIRHYFRANSADRWVVVVAEPDFFRVCLPDGSEFQISVVQIRNARPEGKS